MNASTLPLITQCLLALAAFASLCLATPRHNHRLPFGRHPKHWRAPLRVTGWLLLAAALWVAVSSRGWGLGLVDLFGAVTLAAFVVIAAATYRPGWLAVIGALGLAGGALAIAMLVPAPG